MNAVLTKSKKTIVYIFESSTESNKFLQYLINKPLYVLITPSVSVTNLAFSAVSSHSHACANYVHSFRTSEKLPENLHITTFKFRKFSLKTCAGFQILLRSRYSLTRVFSFLPHRPTIFCQELITPLR